MSSLAHLSFQLMTFLTRSPSLCFLCHSQRAGAGAGVEWSKSGHLVFQRHKCRRCTSRGYNVPFILAHSTQTHCTCGPSMQRTAPTQTHCTPVSACAPLSFPPSLSPYPSQPLSLYRFLYFLFLHLTFVFTSLFLSSLIPFHSLYPFSLSLSLSLSFTFFHSLFFPLSLLFSHTVCQTNLHGKRPVFHANTVDTQITQGYTNCRPQWTSELSVWWLALFFGAINLSRAVIAVESWEPTKPS